MWQVSPIEYVKSGIHFNAVKASVINIPLPSNNSHVANLPLECR